MESSIIKLLIVVSVCSCQTVYSQEVLSNKVLEWTASLWGGGFGHKVYAKDPGSRTVLNIAARHNTALWTDMVSLTSQGNVGIGTENPKAKLAVNGNILAKEVKVKTDIAVPDYVFNPEYELLPLTDIEAFVKQHKHLPEIPSAADIQRDGLALAEMNLLLLKKVEELTLHLIEQRNDNVLLQKQVNNLQHRIIQLESPTNN